ncbi:MAG TPA: SPFH domain-containing protein [Planctomycetota bacterium]|jgi:flotillin|nr:SPFH domain-containing protein [Planctomycetota bacterium]
MPPGPSAQNPYLLAIVAAAVLVAFGFLMMLVKRYKRCPSNRILVIYGKTTEGRSARCLHGGGAFVWPLIQDFEYLNLDPMQIGIPLKGALSAENIRVNVPSVFTVAIGTEPATMQNAAIRLLGLQTTAIVKQTEDIIFGQLRQVIAAMRIEDINRNRDQFLASIQKSLEPELVKIGLVLINVNITDITDESGYIEAIGKKAASEAIQQATIDVAEQVKKGSIGVAAADRDKAVQVASAHREQEIGTKEAERDQIVRVAELTKDKTVGERTAAFEQEAQIKERERQMRIAVADANAKAVTGENLSKALIAATNSELRVKEATAYQTGETKYREAQAAVNEAQYLAEAKAMQALGVKIEQEKRAELEAVAKASKAKQIVDAEAQAEKTRIEAIGEASATFARLEAQAKGEYEILAKKGDGLKRIVEACGGAQPAFQLMMLEHLQALAQTAATAISNIKFDKVIVWDSGNGANGAGPGGGAAGFLQSLAKSIPPMMNVMQDLGGVKMPEFLGKLTTEGGEAAAAKGEAATAKGEATVARKPT